MQERLGDTIAVAQVDGHNIVPVWETSDKQEYAARTIRKKINSKLGEFLTYFPEVCVHPYSLEVKPEKIDWEYLEREHLKEVDHSVKEASWCKPGSRAGLMMLEEFIQKRLRFYGDNKKKNDPNEDVLSNLSPWFHFGQISTQRAILEVIKLKKKYPQSVEIFCEEAIVRRELTDNYCFYNENYDNINGAHDWARKTLNDHRNDKRQYLYSYDQLDKSQTHDDLWNSAQRQMVIEGKMHGFLRMYWAKKILEWTKSPEEAIAFAIRLNDRYNYDGRDPNGYVGVMWSICGVHDQGWKERPIFGKIRFMNYAGCQRKFDVPLFVKKYSLEK
jgi:deoxyribodipyrimidine photo-lyase